MGLENAGDLPYISMSSLDDLNNPFIFDGMQPKYEY